MTDSLHESAERQTGLKVISSMDSVKICVFLVFVLAVILRFYHLGENPPAVYGDEAALGYNGYCLLKTGKDEYGEVFPLVFKSYNDFKSPLYFYLTIPFIALFDLNPVSVRLPSAIAGVLTVFIVYFLAKELVTQDKNYSPSAVHYLPLLAALLLTVSPWHLHVSRGAFEANLCLFFFVLGTWLFLKRGKVSKIFSIFSFAFSLYAYHAAKGVVPLFLPLLVFYKSDFRLKKTVSLLPCFGLFLILIFPLVYYSFLGIGEKRFLQTSIFSIPNIDVKIEAERTLSKTSHYLIRNLFHNKPLFLTRKFFENYLRAFSLDFLYLYGESNLRLMVGSRGEFYLWQFPLFLIGLYFLFARKLKSRTLLALWLLLAPLPSAVTSQTYVLRSVLLLPPMILITALGLAWFLSLKLTRFKLFIVRCLLFVVALFSFVSYLHQYHFEYPNYAADWWGMDNLLTIKYAKEREREFDQIILPETGSMAETFAFYTKFEPRKFQKEETRNVEFLDSVFSKKLGKFYFGGLTLDLKGKERVEEALPANTLLITLPEAYPDFPARTSINNPFDNRILFKVYEKID